MALLYLLCQFLPIEFKDECDEKASLDDDADQEAEGQTWEVEEDKKFKQGISASKTLMNILYESFASDSF